MTKRLRNLAGVVVSVSDDTATRLGREWRPADSDGSGEPDASWKVAALKAYADEQGIDLGDATKKDDILAVIRGE